MITALMLLVCGVMVLGWLLAGIAFVASLVSMITRLLDCSSTATEESASLQPRWCAADTKFLHDVGIRL
jgi:hypothetical protein